MSDQALEQFNERRAERERQNRTLILEGEELRVKPSVAPEVGLRLEDIRRRATADARAAREAHERGDALPEPTVTDQELVDVADDTARACLETDSLEVWQRLRDPSRPNPFTLADLYWLCDHLIARASGLPTERPAASPAGPQPTTRSSTAARPSKAATRKR